MGGKWWFIMQSFQRKCKFGYAHTHRDSYAEEEHTFFAVFFFQYTYFFFWKLHSHSHTTFSRVNILALKKSKLKQERESGVNGVSLKKLSFSSPPDSAPFHPRILMSGGGVKQGEVTETSRTWCVRDTGVSCHPLTQLILKAWGVFYSRFSFVFLIIVIWQFLNYKKRKRRWDLNEQEMLFIYNSFTYSLIEPTTLGPLLPSNTITACMWEKVRLSM